MAQSPIYYQRVQARRFISGPNTNQSPASAADSNLTHFSHRPANNFSQYTRSIVPLPANFFAQATQHTASGTLINLGSFGPGQLSQIEANEARAAPQPRDQQVRNAELAAKRRSLGAEINQVFLKFEQAQQAYIQQPCTQQAAGGQTKIEQLRMDGAAASGTPTAGILKTAQRSSSAAC